MELELLREVYGHPMRLSSAYRCPEWNEKVSSTKSRTGPHTKGAVDVLCYHDRAYDLADSAKTMGWKGIGYNQKGPHEDRFIHLDRREKRTIWSY